MRIAVTGAGGFLGRALIARLKETGCEIKALVKNEATASAFAESGIEAVCLDLSKKDAGSSIFADCQAVIHCAALTRDYGRWEEFRKSNIDTTLNVVEAASKSGIERFIHISTTAVYGNERNHYGTDEEADYGQRVVDPYSRSKIEADRIVCSFIEERHLPAVVLRLGNIWGPGDQTVIPFIVDGLKSRRLMLEGGGDNGLSLTFIDNAVEGILLALKSKSATGRIFNLTDGGKVTSRNFVEDIIGVLGIEYNLRDISYPLLYSAAFILERYYLLTRRSSKPPLTRFAARFLKYDAIFDISRALKELGYHPRISYREGLTITTPYIRSLYYGHK